jgi:hypothetical protein
MLRPGPQSSSSMSSEVTSRQRNRVQASPPAGLTDHPVRARWNHHGDSRPSIGKILRDPQGHVALGRTSFQPGSPPLRISNRDETNGEAGELPRSKGERRQRR